MQLLPIQADQAIHLDLDPNLDSSIPLRVHQRYTRLEVLAALGEGTVARPPTSREGVRYIARHQADVFFVNLQKTPGRFSPSTMYRDYAISPQLFHWESQSTTTQASPTAQRYIHHQAQGSHVLIFAREAPQGPSGQTLPFLFLGPATYQSHRGERPLAITWRLHHPLPHDFFQLARAVA